MPPSGSTVRRLNKRPLVIGIGCVVALLGAAGWALYSVSDSGGSSSQKENTGDAGCGFRIRDPGQSSELRRDSGGYAGASQGGATQARPPGPQASACRPGCDHPSPDDRGARDDGDGDRRKEGCVGKLLPAARRQSDAPPGGPEGCSDIGHHANPGQLHHGDGRAGWRLPYG
jgi:hypothetical protein